MHGVVLVLHLLVLALAILPRALRTGSISDLRELESAYERVGIPALVLQVVTGAWLAYQLTPEISRWLAFDEPVARVIGIKLVLLATTVALAADARIRIIPRLTPERLPALAWHIVPVTFVAVLYVVVGASFRTGWLY